MIRAKIFSAIFIIMLTHPLVDPYFLLPPFGPNSDCAADAPDAASYLWDYAEPTCNWRLLKAI